MTTSGYVALTRSVALLEAGRVVFAVRGPRARRIVNGLVTNSLEGLERGVGCYAFALTAKGRPIADLRVLPPPGFEGGPEPGGEPSPEELWIDAPAAAADGLRDLFARTVPPIFATVHEVDVRRLSLVGRAEPELVGTCGVTFDPVSVGELEPLRCATASLGPGHAHPGGLLVAREAIEGGGLDLYVPTAEADRLRTCLEAAVHDAGGSVATTADWEIVRTELGLPEFGSEITPDNLPQETGQTERAISFQKGCYTGQEVVARIHYRGHVNRLLRGLRAEGPSASALLYGAPLSAGGRQVGRVGCAVDSPRFGRIALAYVRREVAPGHRVALGAEAADEAEVVELPFTER